ncbi:prevent-host-death family protein [Clostridium sp. CAG:557]|jgi:antitoxin YefM|nr:prevent-host-death family protein [Clostridium sp. CAG:557]
MLAVNYSNMRDNFKDYCDKVTDDYETVIVTRKNDKNVVMISLEEYNNMKENLYIMSNKKDYDRLVTSKKQLEAGKGTVAKSIEELRQLEDE